MQIIGLARLGRDAELRATPSGEKVASLSLAFNYGPKGQDGNRPTQWIDGSLWGKRAEVLIEYLRKGQQVVVTLDDPHIEEYQGRNGNGVKLVARVSQIELAGSKNEQNGANSANTPAQRPAPAAQPQRQAPAPRPAPGGFDDDDSDVPF